MFFRIQKSKKDEPESQFSQLNQQTIYFAFFIILAITHNKLPTNFVILAITHNDNSIIPRGFDIRP